MNSPTPETKTLLRGTLVVSLLTQVSRVLGFVREVLTGPLLGTGFFSDAYFVAFRIPNLLRSFVAEGAMTSAFVPLFAGELEKDRAAAARALREVAGFLLQVTLGLSVLGIIFAPQIVHFFSPGFDAEKIAYCTSLTRIMLPYIVLISFISLLNGVLNSVHIFGSAAFAQVLMNVMLIAGALIAFLFSIERAAMVLSWSVLAGGALGVVSQIPSLRRAGFSATFCFSGRSPAVRQLVALMLPALLGASIYQINILVSTQLASLLREGTVSWIYYGDRLAQLPIGVFTVALGSVLLPTLSRAHARGDSTMFSTQLMDSLRYTSFLIIPVAWVLYYFSDSFFTVVFEHGKFTHTSSLRCAEALRAFSLGLWAVSCYAIAIKAFLARKDTRTPMFIGALSLVANVLFALLLMGAPESSHAGVVRNLVAGSQALLAPILPQADLGHFGIALASSLASWVSFALLAFLLTRSLPQLEWRAFVVATAKSLGAAAICMLLLEAVDVRSLPPLYFLILGLPLSGIGFFAVAKLLRSGEAAAALALLAKVPGKIRGHISARGSF